MFNHIITIFSYLKWAWNFLLHYSFFQTHHPHHVNYYIPEDQDHDEDSAHPEGLFRYRRAPGSEESVECAVCLCKIEDGEEIWELKCGHLFHRVCLDRWLGYRHVTCPLCRGSLLAARGRVTEVGTQVLVFEFSSFGSGSRRDTWWLR